ncbi:MAG: PAS domain S-box protein [Desulfobacteraceae bacterium]|nr:MAG: PAS domain S-box protein [Desulfobacteraceae bacterium]
MKIKTQFLITMLLFSIILVVIAASAIVTTQRVEKAEDRERIAGRVTRGASELSYLANDYLIHGEPQQLKRWLTRFNTFSAEAAMLQPDISEQQALVAKIKSDQKRLKEVFDSTVSALEHRLANKAAALDLEFLQVAWSRMAVQIQGLISDASRLSQMCDKEIDLLREARSRLLYAMMGLFGAFLLLSYMVTYRRILRSLATLQAGTAVIGAGKLDFIVEEKGNDEIGDLSKAFNRMTAELKNITACKEDLEKEVSERKQAEERVRESEQRWATTLASIGDAVIAADLEGRVTFLNTVAEGLTGWTLREASGKPVKEIFHIVNEGTREQAENPVAKVLLEGNVVGLANHTVLIRKNGTEVAIDDSGAPIKDASGNLMGVILVFRDITERRKIEQALRRSAQFPEENPSPVLRIGPGGDLLYANAPARNWLATFGPQADDTLPSPVREAVDKTSGQERVIATEIRNPAGAVFWASAARPPGEEYVNLYCTDITERKRAEEALRASEHRVRAKLDAILSPQGDIGKLDLADMIDSRAIQALMETFHKLAGIPMSILDLKGKVLVGVGWQRICTEFHRAHPETCAHCVESDTQLSAGLAAGEVKLYKCRNHMWDIATPIYIGGRHVGNVLSGQFLFEGERIDHDLFRDQARRYGFDPAEYIAALEVVPRLSRGTVDTGMAFFTKLTEMLSKLSYSNIRLARLLSERDRLAESLRQSKQRLQRAQEIAHLGSWELDLKKNDLTWSDEVYRIFGLEQHEFGATFEAFLDRVHPDDRAAVEAAYRDSLLQKRDQYEIEHRVVRKSDGRIRFVHEKCEHFRDGEGAIIRSFGMVHDITERRQAEEALRRSERRYRSFVEVTSQFAWVTDARGHVVEDVPALRSFTGQTYEQAKGAGWADALHPEDAQRTLDVWTLAVFEKRMYEAEYRMKRHDGVFRHLLARGVPIVDDEANVVEWVGTCIDITEQKLAREALQEHARRLEDTNRELEGFAYTISHDLRAPLRAINGFARMFTEDYGHLLDEEGRRRLEVIRTSAIKMGALIDDLLAFSRAGRTAMQNSGIDMAGLVADVLDVLKASRAVDAEIHVKPLPAAQGDPALIRQVLVNLLENALKFSRNKPNPRVEVGSFEKDGANVYFVKDNGIGFDMKYYGKLFGVFQRLVTEKEFEGTGAGLAIVQRLVTRHGGRVWAESIPGDGATFFFTLN